MDLQWLSPVLWSLSGGIAPEGLPSPPSSPGPGQPRVEKQADTGVRLGVAGAGNPQSFQKWPECLSSAPESGIFSTTSKQWGWLPSQASKARGLVVRLSKLLGKKGGRDSPLRSREPHRLNYPLPVAKCRASAPGPWGPPLRVQGGQEGSFSSLPSLLGRR